MGKGANSATATRGGGATATVIGGGAVLLWATLALLTDLTGRVPPFQLMAMSFAVAFVTVVVVWLARGERPLGHLRQPPLAWVLGVGGLFGYHFFYFLALRNAPPVEAGLIAYLWPLLIVLMSALLPGMRLGWWHIGGAVAGLAGTVLLVTDGGGLQFKSEFALGYGGAVVCALTWSSYSVLSRRMAHVPTDAVGGFCGATAVFGLVAHLIFEQTVWPGDLVQWAAVVALGLGPVGAAFFLWDYGVKRGDIRVLGAASYAAPLLSTLLLVGFGRGQASWALGGACLLITGGGILAARDMLFRRSD